jgi:hypothetical protein
MDAQNTPTTSEAVHLAEEVARRAWPPEGYHACGYYDLPAGKQCRKWVEDRYLFCYQHAIDAGLVTGRHRCAHVGPDGQPCRRVVRGDERRCWQHRPTK